MCCPEYSKDVILFPSDPESPEYEYPGDDEYVEYEAQYDYDAGPLQEYPKVLH